MIRNRKKSEIANPYELFGKHMEEGSTHEVDGRKAHHFLPVVIPVIAVAKEQHVVSYSRIR